MEKWGGMQEKVGRGEDKGGMRDGRGVDPEVKMEEGASEGESPNRKEGLVLQKGERGGERVGRSLEKSPEIGFETGKSAKNGDFGAKKEGWGRGEKWALLPILQCYEMAKWDQMNFSRIFFRRSLAGNAEMPYLCTRNREATLLQERVTL